MKPATACVAEFRWPLALGVALAVSTAGCLILPTPEYDTGKARDNISKRTPKQFEAGKSTRAEVVMALGEPDAVSSDESKLAYRSEKVCGLWFVGGYYSGTGGTITKDRYLVVEFDAPRGAAKSRANFDLVRLRIRRHVADRCHPRRWPQLASPSPRMARSGW